MTAMTMTRKYILFTELTTRPIQSSRPDVCVCMVRCMLSPRHKTVFKVFLLSTKFRKSKIKIKSQKLKKQKVKALTNFKNVNNAIS